MREATARDHRWRVPGAAGARQADQGARLAQRSSHVYSRDSGDESRAHGSICNARVTCMSGEVIPLKRGGPEEDAGVLWRALADPTRRRILDLLRERPRVTGEIAAQFPVS